MHGHLAAVRAVLVAGAIATALVAAGVAGWAVATWWRSGIEPDDLEATARLTFADEFDRLALVERGFGTWRTTTYW